MVSVVIGAGAFALAGELGWSSSIALLGSCLLCGLGFTDDVAGLSPAVRLLATLAVATFLCSLLLPVQDYIQIATSLLAALGVTFFVNVTNFMDGVNGLAALHAIFTGVWLTSVAYHWDVSTLPTLPALVGAATLGFLPSNFPNSAVFLGDSGSYAIGAASGLSAIILASNGVPIIVCLAPLFLQSLDVTVTLGRRAFTGQPLTRPHRDHVYQRLTDLGASHAVVSVTVLCASVLTAISILIADQQPIAGSLLLGALVAIYATSPTWLIALRKRSV